MESIFKRGKNTFVISVLVSIAVFIVIMLFTWLSVNRLHQKEILETTDRFIAFKSNAERLIYSNITLLQGFNAYLQSSSDFDSAGTNTYMENLLANNSNKIRNIGVIKDTTIIWNYPGETNKAAIGVDLAKIDGQKEPVLKVKKELVSVLQGPVDLVQGGSGFIARIPVLKKDIGYWGQISIVLKSDEIIRELELYAEEADLNIVVFSRVKNQELQFMGDKDADIASMLEFQIDKDLINWKAYAEPEGGWHNELPLIISVIIAAIAGSILIGLFAGKIIETHRKLMVLSFQDSLTGLYNRHFLDKYMKIILSAAQRNNKKAAVMIMDINKFKNVNDSYGHKMGDLVLVETSRILREMTRENETVFRIGGDEFLIAIPEIESEETLINFKERLNFGYCKYFSIPDYKMDVSLSIGYSIYPDEGKNMDDLLQIADKKMYEEKRAVK
ncbi:MAG: sensor domain-containing diguanylate cyclase [Clostridiales bacterium]|nr:sensor domain-containing diguanylate cyclase [Clostridiales bacterium]